MLDFQVKFLLVLVLCSACYCQEDSISICIKSEEATACQQKNVNFTISQLSGLPALLESYDDMQALHIYLTEGTHFLTTSLHLNIYSNTEIEGDRFTTTTIQCMETSEIKLFVNSLSIQNLNNNNCAYRIILNLFLIKTIKLFNESDDEWMKLQLINNEGQFQLHIDNSQFINGSAMVYDNTNISHSIYYGSEDTIITVKILVEAMFKNIKIVVTKTNFTGSAFKLFTLNTDIYMDKCAFTNYNGTALILLSFAVRHDFSEKKNEIKINNSLFTKNARALKIQSLGEHSININCCNFTEHHTSIQHNESLQFGGTFPVVDITASPPDGKASIHITNSNFRGNYYYKKTKGLDCSSIRIEGIQKTELENVTVIDNNCTAMIIGYSEVTIRNKVKLIRNAGNHGTINVLNDFPVQIIIASQSQLYIINNTALRYGGGIYNDAACSSNYVGDCFLKMSATPNSSSTIVFSGNRAKFGGDMVYGGCMSNCKMELNGKKEDVHIANSSNIFWDYAYSDSFSDSAFVEEPTRVVFCDITSDNTHSTCRNDTEMTITVIRGQEFQVPLMAVDNNCFPSAQYITATTDEGINIIWPGELRFTKRSCSNYSYAIGGNNIAQNTTNIEFYLNDDIYSKKPLTVIVTLIKCPIGYKLDSQGACTCDGTATNTLHLYQIKCIKSDFSLEIPALTWIGEKDGDIIALSKDCRYCHKNSLTKILRDSNELCTQNRTGILCGKCIEGYSLHFSGDKCGECKGSTLKGTVLSISLAIIGIVLILLLLTLNITVSTGIINTLIFYSNIVYLNNNAFLPILDNTEHNHLQNVIRFLSSFQAWMNLDIGISVCFFDHYNTYIHTWSQFTYPIYIWLLILLIVCASRYSRRLAKLTASNIVPVLATLLLLSYSKLLTVSINVLSYSELYTASGTDKVWELDGHIRYLQGKHIPLFLMSILMTVAYIIPFTLLVLLGPLLQAKSHHRLLSWINKLKPLMDAFYGPYSNRYRYWPGILLLVRVVLFIASALLHGNASLATITVVVIALLILWSLISQNTKFAPYRNRHLNYLEYFFHFNLGIFSIMTGLSKSPYSQQVLAVIMTGSAFAIFCGITMYHTACALLKFKVLHKVYMLAQHKISEHIGGQKTTPTQEGDDTAGKKETGDGCTHTTLAMTEGAQGIELREPLLTT